MSLATVAYGARGSGKTTLGAVVAEEVTKQQQRFCAIDLKGDWYGLKSSADGRQEGIPAVIFGGDRADLPLEEGAGAFVAETVAALEQSTILDFEHFSKGKQIRFLASFFATLYDKNREPLLLLLDEAQRYAPQRPISPEQQVCLGAVEDLVKLGRKHGIGVVLFTQRGSGLNKEVSEICDMLVAFRTPGPLDQDRVKDWLEANVTKEQRDQVLGLLAGLETGTAIFASGHPSLKLFKVAHVRQRETFDSSATPKVGHRRREPKRLAKPDLEALKIKMAATIERAKAEDPRELRRRIKELEGTLAKANVMAERIDNKLEKVQVKEKRVEVPVLKDGQIKRIEMALSRAEKFRDPLNLYLQKIDCVKAAISQVASEIMRAVNAVKDSQAPPAMIHIPIRGTITAHRRSVEQPSKKASPTPSGQSETLPKGEHRVLIAIAQHEAGVTRDQVTILTGYKRSTRDAYIQRLKERAFIGMYGPTILATAEGIASLGSDFSRLPTGDTLREYWLTHLPDGERRVLIVLTEGYPKFIERDNISEVTGYKRSTRDAYLQRLRLRKLIEGDGSGSVRASEHLFG